ncbi:hypothetical protein B0T16DRAFT_402762 [Cercophora newfieldiana]|uniref:GST N-terminal domain-containing protein n=1 Tax=Cercophora newfieldiana TaxID=92897 RepID=A0AA39YUP3_9PEZI|nr:hypothetical protein B0T16DRAFT_402762 [Cercophora newfieldiana]
MPRGVGRRLGLQSSAASKYLVSHSKSVLLRASDDCCVGIFDFGQRRYFGQPVPLLCRIPSHLQAETTRSFPIRHAPTAPGRGRRLGPSSSHLSVVLRPKPILRHKRDRQGAVDSTLSEPAVITVEEPRGCSWNTKHHQIQRFNMASDPIILFDIPTREPRTTWSLNPWKTRFMFAYKGLDFKTEWVEYPDIKSRLEAHITPPWKQPIYTIPTVRFPDGTYLMDSKRIAEAINERYPNPPLRIESKHYTWLEKNYGRLMTDFEGVYLPNIPRRLLSEASQPYWYRTREEDVGMSLDQLEKERGGEVAWGLVEPLLKEVAGMLRENGEGPYFLGKEVSYADFWWAGFLLFVRKIGEDLWEELVRRSGEDGGAHGELLEGVKVWCERVDH